MGGELKKRVAQRFETTPNDMVRGQALTLSTTVAEPELTTQAGVLSLRMQELARSYIGARHRAGVAILEAARWISEANQEARHGEWRTFLEATGTTVNEAEYLMGVHRQAMASPIFADAVRKNFLTLSTAYELASAPADTQDRLLGTGKKITRKQIRDEKQAVKSHAGVSFEAPAADEEPKIPELTDDDDDPPVGIAQAGRVFAEHGYAARLGSDDLWEVRREGKVTKVLTRAQMITHAAALTFLAERRAVLARFDTYAMVRQVDYYAALDQIAALLE